MVYSTFCDSYKENMSCSNQTASTKFLYCTIWMEKASDNFPDESSIGITPYLSISKKYNIPRECYLQEYLSRPRSTVDALGYRGAQTSLSVHFAYYNYISEH